MSCQGSRRLYHGAMNALAFDTLAYAKRLEGAGFSRAQAETLAEEQARLIDERLATKTDIETVKAEIESVRADIEALRLSTKADIEALRLSTKADIEALRLTTKSEIEAVKAGVEALRLTTKADLAETRADIIRWVVGAIGFQALALLAGVAVLLKLLGH